MFGIEYLWNGWVKRDGVNANLNFGNPTDFALFK